VTSPTVSDFLGRLQGVRANGSGWSARCPCRNDDHNPSLSIGEGRDGRVLVTCHRGVACSVSEICEAMGMSVADLMAEPKASKGALDLVEVYDYLDTDGTLLFQKLRYLDRDSGRKTFRQRKPDGTGGWSWSLGDTPKVLYNLPEVTRAAAGGQAVFVVEGEKDANALIREGYVATTMPGGAGKWLSLHTEALVGARVAVVCDNDDVGREHATTVVAALEHAGIDVRALAPPERFKDIAEALGAGLTVADLVPLVSPVPSDTDPAEEADDDTEIDAFAEVVDALVHLADDPRLDSYAKLSKARHLLDAAAAATEVPDLEAIDWFDFVGEDDEGYDWVIPGLLERTDRVIVVASEGGGKTTLARQVAITAACGLHPFTRARIPRVRTLTIDLENPSRIIRRKSATIMGAAMRYSRDSARPHAQLVIKPSGLNLLKSADRVRLERVIEAHEPDIVFLGPLYKAFIDPGGRNSESVATELIMFLDYLRETYRCALWMEQHAPLGSSASGRDLRPFGSAVWSRWPEFGLALERDLTATTPNTFRVKDFRGARDERQWPTLLRWGRDFPFDALEYRTV
jgi:hypothetical protein